MLARRCRRSGVTGRAAYDQRMPDDLIADAEELREFVGVPIQRTLEKQLDHLDRHCVDFLARSPFATLATSGADGRCDSSPRGGPAGFAHVIDPKHVALPDYKGNRRQDSHVNVMENPHVGLLFLIPGFGETLRINGRAQLSRDPDLLSVLATRGDTPHLALVVEAEEVYLHCAKACMRSEIWDPTTWLPKDELPSATQIYRDHRDTPGLTVEQVEAELEESFRTRMW
jgi:PPOX class probable FMN-dependent enzyme